MWSVNNLSICNLSKADAALSYDRIRLPDTDGLEVQFYSHIEQAEELWNSYAPQGAFLKSPFLRALEMAPPSDSQYRYAVYYKDAQVVGLVYFQIKTIRLDESLRFEDDPSLSRAQRVTNHFKKSVAARFRAYTLVVGNLTLTGNYGIWLSDAYRDRAFYYVEKAVQQLLPLLRSEGIKVRAIMYKDFDEQQRMTSVEGYTEFSVQPKMTVHLRPDWQSTDDYLSAMKSKYRVRYRRARSKAEKVEKRLLSPEEIQQYESDITRLYRHVSDQADFNLFILKPDYFYQLQLHLGNLMKTTGYFLDGKMVGFFTSIRNDDALDAHFLGYDPEHNGACQLYLNMLYDLVEEGINQHVSHVDMSRTALEIKSSVGAVPTDLYLYLRLTSERLNKYTPKLLQYFTPEEEWKARSPFK